MKTNATLSLMLVLAWCLLPADAAHALYSCSVTPSGIGAAYDPLAGAAKVTQSSVTVTCLRAASDSGTLDYVLTASNGANSTGQGNFARLGAQTMSYDLFRDSLCTVRWRSTGNNYFSGTLNFAGALSTTLTLDYWACIPAGQTGLAAGTYTDSVVATLTYGNTNKTLQTATGGFGAAISTPAQCLISSPPGLIDFGTYVAFGGAATGSTTFGVTCTSYLSYTLALDATFGVLTGLNYVLSLPAGGVGTGAQQMLSITGSVPPGQAGQCGAGTCSGTNLHTLTLTY